jgi:uncharacterized protein (TIGR03067 family)
MRISVAASWIILVSSVAYADDPKDDVKAEMKKLAGTWQVVPLDGFEKDETAKAAAKKLKIMIEGDKYTVFEEGKAVEEGTLQIDPSKQPKTIDMKVTKGDGKGKGRVVECIYQLEKDHLLLCTALPGKSRPEKFVSMAGSALTKLVREKKE